MGFWNFFKRAAWRKRGKVITRDRAYEIIRDNIGPGPRIWLRDGAPEFRVLSRRDWEGLIFKARKLDPDYISNVFDCENFGDCFMADIARFWAFQWGREPLLYGWISIREEGADADHWLNWVVDADEIMRLVEPQRNGGEFVTPSLEAIREVTQ